MMTPELHRWFVETASRQSQKLARDIAAHGPLWFPDREDHGPAAFLARAIIGQQISAAAARGIWARIETSARDRGMSIADFFRHTDAPTLRACGLSGNKAKAVLHIQEAAALGLLGELRTLDAAERAQRLLGIWGVGPWTRDMTAIFYCRDPDIWPEGDLAVMRAFRGYIGRRKPAKASASFAPYRSLLALYMWRFAGGQP
ncbi:MAG TPA: hypothetical protein VL993_00930 [Stellaceae bacterium]|nr:hypothetical protein [Stellaceae bacterium]